MVVPMKYDFHPTNEGTHTCRHVSSQGAILLDMRNILDHPGTKTRRRPRGEEGKSRK